MCVCVCSILFSHSCFSSTIVYPLPFHPALLAGSYRVGLNSWHKDTHKENCDLAENMDEQTLPSTVNKGLWGVVVIHFKKTPQSFHPSIHWGTLLLSGHHTDLLNTTKNCFFMRPSPAHSRPVYFKDVRKKKETGELVHIFSVALIIIFYLFIHVFILLQQDTKPSLSIYLYFPMEFVDFIW